MDWRLGERGWDFMVLLKSIWIPTLFAIMGMILVGGCSGCSSVLYQPLRDKVYDPVQLGLPAPEEVHFPSTDGTRLHGWYFRSERPKDQKPHGILVFFHGNGENLSTHFATLAWILNHGYDYLIFDYRGYGQSEGKPNPEGTVQDGIAALRYVSNRFQYIPLVVFAQSLGGAIALRSLLELKGSIPVQLAVIDSSFLSYQTAGRKILSHHWLTWLFQPLAWLLLSDQWAPGDRISEISPTPLIVIHGTRDQIIDYDLGQDLFDKAKEPKEIWKIEGGYHTDVFWRHRQIYRTRFLEALKKYLHPL